jgi:hypothetical protein
MSFSFSAAGTKEQTLESLGNAIVNNNALGDVALAFAKELVNADNTKSDDTHTVRYSVSASGHSDGGVGSTSYASISFSASFEPKPEPSAPAPA